METIKNGKREKKQELKWKLMTLPKEPKGCLQKKILTLQIRRLRLSDTPMQLKLLTRMITTEELRPLSAPLSLCSLGHLVPHRHKKIFLISRAALSSPGVSKTTAHQSDPIYSLFWYGLQVQNGFYIFRTVITPTKSMWQRLYVASKV